MGPSGRRLLPLQKGRASYPQRTSVCIEAGAAAAILQPEDKSQLDDQVKMSSACVSDDVDLWNEPPPTSCYRKLLVTLLCHLKFLGLLTLKAFKLMVPTAVPAPHSLV